MPQMNHDMAWYVCLQVRHEMAGQVGLLMIETVQLFLYKLEKWQEED